MKFYKTVCCGILLALSFTCLCYGGENIKINVDGKNIESDVSPQIIEGRTLVPIRTVGEALGADVDWNSETKEITVENSETKVNFIIGDKNCTIIDKKINAYNKTLMDVPAQIINGRTYIPVRAVSTALGCDVDWDSNTRTVIINVIKAESTTEVTTLAPTTVTETETEFTTVNPLSLNGNFKVGEDLEEGSYKFKKADGCNFGFIKIRRPNKNNSYFMKDDDKIAESLKNVVDILIINCDIYKDDTLYIKHSDYKANINMDIANVTPELKKRISQDINDMIEQYSERVDSIYMNRFVSIWKSMIKNDEDEKYVELISECFESLSKFAYNNYEHDIKKDKRFYKKGIDLVPPDYNNNIFIVKQYLLIDLRKLDEAKSFNEVDEIRNDLKQYEYSFNEYDGRVESVIIRR